MNRMGSIQENSPADISPSPSSTSQGCVDFSSASLTSPIANGILEANHHYTELEDSKISAAQDVLCNPAVVQKTLVPIENAVRSEPRVEEILEANNIPLPSSLEIPKAHLSDSPPHPANGGSINISDIYIEGSFPSIASTAMRGCTDKFLNVPSNDHNQLQLEAAGVVYRTAESICNFKYIEQANMWRGLVENASPFESVKEAVSKFGGITNWTAQKILSTERLKHVEHELEKAQQKIPQYKKQLEAAEDAKAQELAEVDSTNRLIEELKLEAEREHTEEAKVKLDSELVRVMIPEMEQKIGNETSFAVKAEVEVAKAGHTEAIAELKLVKEEMKALQGKYTSLVNDRDMAIKRAQKAVSESTEIDKAVEELSLKLIAAKEALESAHSAHRTAEEQRIAAAMAREQDSLNWKKELKQAGEEVEKLHKQLSSANDLKSKLDTASAFILNLEIEMESRSTQDTIDSIDNEDNRKGELGQKVINPTETQTAVISARRELEEGKVDIEKAKEDVKCLRVAAASLKLELEKEKAALAAMRERQGMASTVVASLKVELNGTLSELDPVQMKEKMAKEMIADLPRVVEQATQEADQAKLEAALAREELQKAKEEAEHARAGLSTIEIRLGAALKEIDATKASERLALASVKALEENELNASMEEKAATLTGVTLSLEEYNTLSRRAHEVEEQSHLRVAAAISQIELAKESESRTLVNLEEANREMGVKEALKMALERAERANEGKLIAEQELRKWREENQQKRKAIDAGPKMVNPMLPRRNEDGEELKDFDKDQNSSEYSSQPLSNPNVSMHGAAASETDVKKKKKKKTIFPRIVLFMGKKNSQSTK